MYVCVGEVQVCVCACMCAYVHVCVHLGTTQVGTGFSFTQKDSGYSTNEVEVGANLYK